MKAIQAMMLGMGEGIRNLMHRNKNHDTLVALGFTFNGKEYRDANGNLVKGELNEKGHYFDGHHWYDAWGRIVDS